MCLVIPVMVMLAFGVVEYASFISVKASIQQAAREGAREAIRSTATNTSVQSAISAVMTNAGLQGSGYTVTISPASVQGLPTGQAVTITVSCTWANVGMHALPAGMGQISDSKVITETVLMNRE